MHNLEDEEATVMEAVDQLGTSTNDHACSHFKSKSKFCPTLNPGNKIDLFYDAVTADLETLKNQKQPQDKENLTEEERQALNQLITNDKIIRKPADKGGNVVILSRKEYVKEAMRQLSDTQSYQKLDKNPT
ncbi:hypothetical protein NDU88_002178 [Pleurodeles waltl]|uniref:Uncharacterized protein n=1 Tax=Pleurodeles waltl TaxID=8319 RepID=A0AAV7PEL3_PLEWA|nr:hypothetical protein NDU88_002178 [Pleurodeles waltl]